MIVKIINQSSEDYNKEFKVRRMNYDQVVIIYNSAGQIKVLNNEEVQFIQENDVDEFLIKYRDFLKIKLNRGISVIFYKTLLEAIEVQFKVQFENLNLLKDKYSVNKRGIWEKEIIAVVNDNIPIKIMASGQNFKKTMFNINLEEISKDEFMNICLFEIEKVKKEIEEKELVLARYGMAMEKINKKIEPNKWLK